MIPLEQAWDHVRSRLPELPVETVPLADALGLVCAEEVTSGEDLPPFDNTAVDGFAVRAADVAQVPVTLQVAGTVAAGSAEDVPVGAGEAVRIMTGAPIPGGAEAVVMVEDTEVDGDRVRIGRSVAPGANVRPAGDDLLAGDVVVAAGAVLTPGRLGLLATVGRTAVAVRRRPRVGVLSTGDELVDGPVPLQRGQIRDSNRPTLVALAAAAGFEAVDLGRAPDDEAAIEASLRDGAARCDALLTSGGVSMGDFDYVKAVLDRLGDMRWMQIAIRPAKPFAFGLVDGVPVFGLPGNPVSSMVSFELLARPGIRAMAGHTEPHRRRVRAVADHDLPRRADGKIHFVRVAVSQDAEWGFHVRSSGGQGSHQLSAMAAGNGLVVLPDGEGAAAGDTVEVLLLD